MKKCFSLLLAAVLISSAVVAQSPPTGYIGLYIDEEHSQNEVEMTVPGVFDLYVFCRPSENGMMCAEFALSTGGVVITSQTSNPGVSVALGSIPEGLSVCFLECQNDWVWTTSAQVYVGTPAAAQLSIIRHPDVGKYQFASCLGEMPLEPVFVSSRVCVNMSCPPDTEAPIPLAVDTSDGENLYLYFNEEIFEPDAEIEENYYAFNHYYPYDSIAVEWADPQEPGYSHVRLRLATPANESSTYRLRVSNIRDIAGNMIPEGTEIFFAGNDEIPPECVSVTAVNDSQVVVLFTEVITESSAEEPGNYQVWQVGGTAVAVTGAERTGSGETVLLDLGSPLLQNETYGLSANSLFDYAGNEIVWDEYALFKPIDRTAPMVESVVAQSETAVRISFNEPVAASTAIDTSNYDIWRTDDPADEIVINNIEMVSDTDVRITLMGWLLYHVNYSVNIVGVEDIAGFAIEPPGITEEFFLPDEQRPFIQSASALNDTTIELTFNEPMDSVTALAEENYQVYQTNDHGQIISIISASMSGSGEKIVLDLASPIVHGISYTVKAVGLYDRYGNIITTPNTATILIPDVDPPELVAAIFESMSILQVEFNERVQTASAEEESNYTIFRVSDPGVLVPITDASLGVTGTIVTLILGEDLIDGESYILRVNDVEDIYDNVIAPDSEIGFIAADVYPPRFLFVAIIDTVNIDAVFNEDLDAVSASNTANYEIFITSIPYEFIPVSAAALQPEGNIVRLTTGAPLLPGLVYSLRITGVLDEAGNPIQPGSTREFSFYYGDEPAVAGLYFDEQRFSSCENGTGIRNVQMWIWFRPSQFGLICSEFRIDYPSNIMATEIIGNPDISVFLGSLETGMSACFATCRYDWVWFFQQELYITDELPSIVAIEPHPQVGEVQVANCNEGYPVENAIVIQDLRINCIEAPPQLEYALLAGETSLAVRFSVPVSQASAGDASNYMLFETGDTLAVTGITGAELDPDSITVYLTLSETLLYGTSYTVRVSNVENLFGSPIVPGSEISFTASETQPPSLLSASMTGQNNVELLFDEKMDEQTSEAVACYHVFETANPTVLLQVLIASLMAGDTSVVLATEEPLVHGTAYTVRASGVEDISGNPIGLNNEAEFIADDVYSPLVESSTIFTSNSVRIFFNEDLEQASAENTANYIMHNANVPSETIPVTSSALAGNRITLALAYDIPPWTPYVLEISDVEDLAGNAVEPGTTVLFNREYGYPESIIGIYADEYMSDNSVEPAPYTLFYGYVWAKPSSEGMICAEYALENVSDGGIFECPPVGFENNGPIVSVSLGEPYLGISVCFSSCQTDWVWVTRVQYLFLAGSGFIHPIGHPDVGILQQATCLPGFPIVPSQEGSWLDVNRVSIATLLESSTASFTDGGIEVAWTLQESSEVPVFHIGRAVEGRSIFEEIPSPDIRQEGMEFTFVDIDYVPGESYRYRVEYELAGSTKLLFETEPVKTPVMALSLGQNRPNPFNPSTSIEYYLPAGTDVRLEVFDVSGRRICLLDSGFRQQGRHVVEWNGTDSSGSSVSSGIYFYRLIAGKDVLSRKMVLLR